VPVIKPLKNETDRNGLSCDGGYHKKSFKLFILRIETLVLLAGLIITIWGKLTILFPQKSLIVFPELVQVVFPDILFFAITILIVRLLYLLKPSIHTARCVLVVAILILGWSVLNVGWLINSGVQLQPSVLKALVGNFKQLWPYVRPYLANNLTQMTILLITFVITCCFFTWRFLKPRKIIISRLYHARLLLLEILIVAVLLLIQTRIQSLSNTSFSANVLGFSSHWHALTATIQAPRGTQLYNVQSKNIPRAGERQVVVPQSSPDKLPNIVLVLLESVSYSATPLYDSKLDTMPYLAQLAQEGVEFQLTYVPVSHTTKAFWATLTATTPEIRGDYVEAIPMARPYEGLPTILAKAGYRSVFFEMSRGSFECAPGFFSNLGFDWAWFRENLEDSSAHIGLVAGDDCKIIRPATEWALEGPEPFFLMMITTVSHEPYEVPGWFGEPKTSQHEKYLQSVRYTDYFLKRLCEELNKNGLNDNTLLCVLGDHGTSFRSHSNIARWSPYEEILRVPWIIHWPGHIESGKKINWPCSQLDVTPTILDLIGFDISQAGFEGKSAFIPSKSDRRLYFSSWYDEGPIGFVEGNRKIVYWPYLEKIFEYDLKLDPNEDNPITVPSDGSKRFKKDILSWKEASRVEIDTRYSTNQLLYSHWQTFSAGRSAWAYYMP